MHFSFSIFLCSFQTVFLHPNIWSQFCFSAVFAPLVWNIWSTHSLLPFLLQPLVYLTASHINWHKLPLTSLPAPLSNFLNFRQQLWVFGPRRANKKSNIHYSGRRKSACRSGDRVWQSNAALITECSETHLRQIRLPTAEGSSTVSRIWLKAKKREKKVTKI